MRWDDPQLAIRWPLPVADPTLMGRIHTWHTHKPYLDIGTPAALAAAQQLLSEPWH